MNQIEEQLKNLNTKRLPDEVRVRMREEIFAYAELHTAPEAAGGSVRSPFSYLYFRLYSGLAAVAFIIIALGGTAYASEKALPGDVLYPVKVGIAEPLQTALVPSDRGKASWHAILAERRLEEAAQLAANGRLSTDAQDQLAVNFDSQVNASQKSAVRLEHNGDANGSLSVRSDLEARLSAHEHILSVIDAHYALVTTTDAQATHDALQRMLTVVTNHEREVVSGRIALEDSLSPGTKKDGEDGGTQAAKVALSTHIGAHIRFNGQVPSAAESETAAAGRTAEEAHILQRNAAFLAKFLPVATTTATSTATTTATTTASTTEQGEIKNGGMDDAQQGQFEDEENINQ